MGPCAGFPVAQTAIVGGDEKSFSIAAASVIAKVTREPSDDPVARAIPTVQFSRGTKDTARPNTWPHWSNTGRRPYTAKVSHRCVMPWNWFRKRASNPTAQLELGERGEDAAVKFFAPQRLQDSRAPIQEPRGRDPTSSARQKDSLVFIEVKTRQTEQYGAPSEAVDKEKQRPHDPHCPRLPAPAQ